MAKFVRIKKARNLRFRLISLLYLLFISLSLIQIPIDWMRINPTIADYLNSTTSKSVSLIQIKAALDAVDQIETEFTKVTMLNEQTKSLSEPTGYSTTDKIFIDNKRADYLFAKLIDLKNYFSALPVSNLKRKEFEKLFSGDLENGLKNNNSILWAEWKFKHTPATIVKTLLAELRLRLNLLNGAIELDSKGDKSDKIVLLAYNLDVLKPGDTATFVIAKKSETKVKFDLNGSIVNDYKWKGDTLYFIPKTTGQYNIEFNSKGVIDKLSITVIPAGFAEEKKDPLQTFFVGKKASVKYTNVLKADKVYCTCANGSQISQSIGNIEFTPQSPGWCSFQIESSNGQILLMDSLYVQDIPTPQIIVNGASDNKISLNRILQTKSISIGAFHPDMNVYKYDISKVNYTLIGANRETKSVQSGKIDLGGIDIAKLKYILINEVEITTALKEIKLTQPLLIEIIKS
jgi:hypothetical protein